MENPFIKNLRDAVTLSPDNVLLRKMLAEALLNHGASEEAEQEYKRVLQIIPNDWDAKKGLAVAFFTNDKLSEAEVVAEELIAAQQFEGAMYVLLARIALERDDPQQARDFYATATKIDTNLIDTDLEYAINQEILEKGVGIGVNLSDFDDDLENLVADIEKPKINFSDVGGMATAKEEIALKVIHPLQNPQIYEAFGKKIGGGVLLYGPPGCGKTLLARATAGEINAGFLNVGISDVLDMWLGNSEKNLHEIFQTARASTPSVLFFDEVDALGANRSDMRNAAGRFVINQFLDELDGVRYSNDGVLILAATNTPWYLDPAFRRPGRFDRIIFVAPPDFDARVEIFNIHLKPVPTEGVTVNDLAKLTTDYSGADIKAVVDMAVEAKLPESLKAGRVIPVTQNDLKEAIKRHRPSTKEWFATAKNHALYANHGGLYDDILKYLKISR